MLCKKPNTRGAQVFGCGRCVPCRISRRRIWTHRLMLEAYKHGNSTMATLTYDPDHLPSGGTLVPSDVDAFMHRLRTNWRRSTGGLKIRFYGVGEYGDDTQRPHYHYALFGYPNCSRGRTDHRYDICCGHCQLIKDSWKLGGVDLQELNPVTCQYVCGYVTKKMTKWDDPRLSGRHPEFARMSNRPVS